MNSQNLNKGGFMNTSLKLSDLRTPEDLDRLKKTLDALKERIQFLENNGGDEEQIKELVKIENYLGWIYEKATQPV